MDNWTNADLRSMEETSSEFIAWHIGQRTSWLKCEPSFMFTTTTNNVAACCFTSDIDSDGNCAIATGCFGTRILMDDDSRRNCGENTECKEMDVFENYVPGSLPDSSFRLFLCMSSDWDRRTLYMRIGEATATPTSSESSATSASSTNSTPSPSSSDKVSSLDEEPPSSSASKAWIAGAVIGPLFLMALVVLGIWWYKRRSSTKAAAATGQPLPGDPTRPEAKHYSQPLMVPGYQQQPYLYDPNHQQHQRWSAATGSPPLSASPYQPATQSNGQWAELSGNRPTSPPVEMPTQYHR